MRETSRRTTELPAQFRLFSVSRKPLCLIGDIFRGAIHADDRFPLTVLPLVKVEIGERGQWVARRVLAFRRGGASVAGKSLPLNILIRRAVRQAIIGGYPVEGHRAGHLRSNAA
jgi:hypothetical protein